MALTQQQKRGAQLMAQGYACSDIALMLGVSKNTPSNWRKRPEFQAYVRTISGGSMDIAAERELWAACRVG